MKNPGFPSHIMEMFEKNITSKEAIVELLEDSYVQVKTLYTLVDSYNNEVDINNPISLMGTALLKGLGVDTSLPFNFVTIFNALPLERKKELIDAITTLNNLLVLALSQEEGVSVKEEKTSLDVTKEEVETFKKNFEDLLNETGVKNEPEKPIE